MICSGYLRLSKVSSGYIRLGQDVWLYQVISFEISLDHVSSG